LPILNEVAEQRDYNENLHSEEGLIDYLQNNQRLVN
jgi:hypothetical protein